MLPIVYVNLARDADRRERLEAEFDRHGIVAQRFDATLWTALPEQEQVKLYSPTLNQRQFHKPLVNGEKGCYASHLRTWQWLLDSEAAALVVLEDDIALQPDFGRVIEAIEALPPGWDMIKLIGRDKERPLRRRALVQGTELIDYRRVPSLTAGYVVSRSGAAKLVATRIPFGRPIDVDLRHWWENGLKIHGVLPAAIRLDETSFQSSIGTKAAETRLLTRWRKFINKANYGWQNLRHR
ncbi:glycosyltransferase family 25 protein [Roseateles sp. DC23W]|uniref:Glycosyltransferase family 25 protein n=1 Tax=Pelomonas dachongensis TaxID=3299029 RepID=A0ABW7EIH1_9BURK